jgi:two-component system, OmpR family, sensor histidine kinase KdpD
MPVISAAEPAFAAPVAGKTPGVRGTRTPGGILGAVLPYAVGVILVVVLGVALWKSGIVQANIFSILPFVLAVQITAFAWGRGPAIASAVAAAATFNYYWIGPPYQFELPTTAEWFLFAVMLATALGLGTATERMRIAGQQASQLAASERLERALLDSISHDLRTPLTAIMGALSTLLAEKGPVGRLDAGAREELITIAYERAKMLDRLVGQILDMTRLDAGVMRVHAEPAAVGGLVELALRGVGDAVKAHCRVTVPPDLPAVPMDTPLLSHAVRNIIDNAVRYSPEGSAIEVDAAPGRGEVVVSVADRGSGIPAEDLARVFEKFYRVQGDGASGPRVAAADGLGLGLAIAKGIVEAHGGRIWAERRDGGGTIVRLAIPLAQET